MSEANFQIALREAERSAKKQKTCAGQCATAVGALQQHLQAVRQQIDHGSGDGQAAALARMQQTLAQQRLAEQVGSSTKELHKAVSNLGKAVDKAFVSDICRAPVSGTEMDQAVLDRVIAAHLFQQGRFEIGDAFAREAALECEDSLKRPFEHMHMVLQQIHNRNLEPALQWVEEKRADLAAARQSYEAFEFQLHRLQFLRILTQQGPAPALVYIRRHAKRFHDLQADKVTRLMGCLCYTKRLASSPYADLLAESQWSAIAQEFVRQCCGLMGLALESPLLVAVAAGSVALPTLLKLSDVLAAQKQDLSIGHQLPVEVELGKEFVFHSIFACPVSKDQSTVDNPPMLLPCGHVLCRVSINKIAKNTTRSFKCPYCPNETTPQQCKEIYFPDAGRTEAA
jgi:hypothetical protein